MKFFLYLCAITFIGLACASAVTVYGFLEYKKDGTLAQDTNVVITKGTSVGGIAETLSYHGVINSFALFKIAARLTNQQSNLKAGEYSFQAHVSMKDVLDKLSKGETVLRQVTIPEGKTSFEVVRLLKSKEDLMQDGGTVPSEGALLPDTYAYQKAESVQSLLEHMEKAMSKVLDDAWVDRMPNLPLATKKEALVLASIVEKETGVAAERATIAGVFVNRLRKGMPLQTDPTVIYAITKGAHKNNGKGPLGRRLLRKDLQIDSPYNTYKIVGLPPAPICNPGKDAIIASLHPEAHDYIYFVADGTGGHIFSKTLAEHNRNVSQWRKIRRTQSQSKK